MTTVHIRQIILKANAAYLGASAIVAWLFMDLPAIFLGIGPEGRVIAAAPHTAIGFVEAHGLALILSIVLWRADTTRAWHLTGAATSALLGTANLLFWQAFVDGDALTVGYVTTTLHLTVASAQLLAAFLASTGRAAFSRAPNRLETT